MKYEILDGPEGSVTATIIADEAYMVATYQNFRAVAETLALAPDAWHIGIGPFFDRFGAQKIPILASTDPVVKAIILDCTVRKYIDLAGRRADIDVALDTLITKGFAIDKASILDAVPTDAERYKS